MYHRSFLFGLISIPWPWAAKKPEPPVQKSTSPVMVAVLGGAFPFQSTTKIRSIEKGYLRNPAIAAMRSSAFFEQEGGREFGVAHVVVIGTPEEIAERFRQNLLTAALEMQRCVANCDWPQLSQDAIAATGYTPGQAVTIPLQ